jgi:hypothetical protein
MHTSFYLLITIGALAGFFMRPLNMFVVGKVGLLVKYTNRKPVAIALLFTSMLSALATTFATIYFVLKLAGFIPLGDQAPSFVVSFFIGGALWVIYAKLFNRGCPVNFDQ